MVVYLQISRPWSASNLYFRFSVYIPCTVSGGSPLGIADLATVFSDTYPCRAKWYNLGLQLRVDVGTLDCFKIQYSDPGNQLREVLRTWLTSSGNPTWGSMVEALKNPVIDEAQLAKELQQKYCPSGQPPVDGE